MRVLLVFVLMGILVACDSTDHEGYRRIEDTIHFRLNVLGDETRSVDKDKYVSIEMDVYTADKQHHAHKTLHRVEFSKADWPRYFEEIIGSSHQDDSFSLAGSVGQLDLAHLLSPMVFEDDSAVAFLELRISEVLSPEELIQKRAEERLLRDFEFRAQGYFEHLKDSLQLKESEFVDGIYIRHLSEGEGESPAYGDFVTMHYKTYLVSGKLINDTYRDTPLTYQIGKPGQVLPGFAMGVSKMNRGAKALFVVPSDLAYGQKGSSSGIVPPYYALIYEAELLEISN